MKLHTCLVLLVLIFSGSCASGSENDYEARLMKMKSKFDSIKDYSCTFESYSSNGEKSASVTFKYFFRKPKSVRMEILKGKYSGTTLLLQKDNTVRVKVGMIIVGLFTFTYPADHRYVCDYRGNGLHNSDFGYFIEEHIKLLGLTSVRLAGEEELDGRKVLVYELLSKDLSKSRAVAKETIWIDKDQDLLIKYRQYDSSGQLIQSGYYKNIKINSGLSTSVFTDF
ncbi:MAG TPA: outer membrane lipoprotein-sorting protein [Ignavibacteriales bacterium]|nr:outer membrane lipoprotein-sorting protein [Ignavibacteriales bacterium]